MQVRVESFHAFTSGRLSCTYLACSPHICNIRALAGPAGSPFITAASIWGNKWWGLKQLHPAPTLFTNQRSLLFWCVNTGPVSGKLISSDRYLWSFFGGGGGGFVSFANLKVWNRRLVNVIPWVVTETVRVFMTCKTRLLGSPELLSTVGLLLSICLSLSEGFCVFKAKTQMKKSAPGIASWFNLLDKFFRFRLVFDNSVWSAQKQQLSLVTFLLHTYCILVMR